MARSCITPQSPTIRILSHRPEIFCFSLYTLIIGIPKINTPSHTIYFVYKRTYIHVPMTSIRFPSFYTKKSCIIVPPSRTSQIYGSQTDTKISFFNRDRDRRYIQILCIYQDRRKQSIGFQIIFNMFHFPIKQRRILFFSGKIKHSRTGTHLFRTV